MTQNNEVYMCCGDCSPGRPCLWVGVFAGSWSGEVTVGFHIGFQNRLRTVCQSLVIL